MSYNIDHGVAIRSNPNAWVQVTLDIRKDPTNLARVHYRVHWSREGDWSGWADSEAKAHDAVNRLVQRASLSNCPDTSTETKGK